MVDFNYDAQQTVTSASKLYKKIAHLKLYGTQKVHRLQLATEYDMDKFLPLLLCFMLLHHLLGNFK
jgi:hypothetical protein